MKPLFVVSGHSVVPEVTEKFLLSCGGAAFNKHKKTYREGKKF